MQRIIKLPHHIATLLHGQDTLIKHVKDDIFEISKSKTRSQQNKYFASLRKLSAATGHSVSELHSFFLQEFVGESTVFISDEDFATLILAVEEQLHGL